MERPFAAIAFTPSVVAAQARYGSRFAGSHHEAGIGRRDVLTEAEADFIEQMDGFFQATVGRPGGPTSSSGEALAAS